MNIESPVKGEAVSFELGEDYPELREAVRKICAKYPGAYWRELEERSAYPTEMVRDLTEGGYLAAHRVHIESRVFAAYAHASASSRYPTGLPSDDPPLDLWA